MNSLMNAQREQYINWLAEFRQRFIEAEGWTEKEARRRIRDGWARVRDGKVQRIFDNVNLPADAVPVFEILTPGWWKPPIQIHEQLTGLVTKAMESESSPKDVALGLLSQIEPPDGQDESVEIRRRREHAAFCVWQVLDACEDKSLAEAVKTDAFWQAVLWAFHAGERHAVLELYRNPQLLADLIKAQAFGSGRSPDELTKRLTKSYLELHAERGRSPKLKEVAEAAGGKWSNAEACWQFGKLGPVTHRGPCERLKDIRRKYPA
jgi:hypothetical protein